MLASTRERRVGRSAVDDCEAVHLETTLGRATICAERSRSGKPSRPALGRSTPSSRFTILTRLLAKRR
jgi:hypothetical protein